jgi:serine protease AprX
VRSRITLAAVALLAVLVAVLVGFQGSSHAGAIDAKVEQQVMEDTAAGGTAAFIVYLADQADVSGAAKIADKEARGLYVYRTLKANAAATQGGVKAALDAAGATYTPYWAVNMIATRGDRDLVVSLAQRDDVRAIVSDHAFDGMTGESAPEAIDDGQAADVVEAVESGVTQTNGPSLWSLGFTGQGIVVANQDTGMRWTQAALRTHYRGWGGSVAASDHNYNWWDSVHARIADDGGTNSPVTNPCGRNIVAPCDDQGHGTHTTGTTVGDDAGAGIGTGTNQVGVAPGAKWIGCRNMDAGNGRASTYTECFQFFLAPTDLTGANADPSKRPHVMNNSWGCPLAGELCPRPVMQTIVQNSDAAGIFVVASAGNDGSACSTVLDPPAIYESAFSVGSFSSTNALSSFSSRGPVTSDLSGRMKPDISARGASVRSSYFGSDTQYATLSGTSMAGPHVVGTVALLWSARPHLVRDTARTKWLLTRSANPAVTVPNNSAGCGGIASIPNNHFGWGRVDALAAYNLEPSLEQSITFPAIADRQVGDADFDLAATASSGLDVSYSASGSCTVSGSTVHLTGPGACTVKAAQAGIDVYGIAASSPKPWYPAADVSRTFLVLYAGFSGLRPPFGVVNQPQAGSSFPVKFSLGGSYGLDVFAPGYPKSKACDAADGTLESTSASEPFAYDSGQYKYVWKTDKSWAKSCRELVLRFADTTEQRSTFQFK